MPSISPKAGASGTPASPASRGSRWTGAVLPHPVEADTSNRVATFVVLAFRLWLVIAGGRGASSSWNMGSEGAGAWVGGASGSERGKVSAARLVAVRARRPRTPTAVLDARIHGHGDFVEQILQEAEAHPRPRALPAERAQRAERAIRAACARAGITPDDLTALSPRYGPPWPRSASPRAGSRWPRSPGSSV